MTRHIADTRSPSTGGRLRAFLRLSRRLRDGWHRHEDVNPNRRLVEFLRIARGRVV